MPVDMFVWYCFHSSFVFKRPKYVLFINLPNESKNIAYKSICLKSNGCCVHLYVLLILPCIVNGVWCMVYGDAWQYCGLCYMSE